MLQLEKVIENLPVEIVSFEDRVKNLKSAMMR